MRAKLNPTLFAMLLAITALVTSLWLLKLLHGFSGDTLLGKVNDVPVYMSDFKREKDYLGQTFTAEKFAKLSDPERAGLLKEIYLMKLLSRAALLKGSWRNEDVRKQMNSYHRIVVRQSYLNEIGSEQVTAGEMEKMYKEFVMQMYQREEARVKHILVDSEKEAYNVFSQLQQQPFDHLAMMLSKDRATAFYGGDLGYVLKEDLPNPLGEAVFATEKGNLVGPIESHAGWHVLRVTDRRPVRIPTFEEMSPALKKKLAQKQADSYVNQLLQNATVTFTKSY